MYALEAREIEKRFQEGEQVVHALRGVSISLEPGEVVALEGPSGSGKTTLLSVLGCILTPTAGDLYIQGQRIEPENQGKLPEYRRKWIGFVFQQFNLFPALTVLENVEYALNVKGFRNGEAHQMAKDMIELVGLSDRKNFFPRDLSGGQKQRVAIARAFAGHPPVLLADEPTANLDTELGMQILELFRDVVKREQRALLIVTHDPKVRTIADRVLTIRDGRILS